MASKIRIKRSTGSTAPSSSELANAELAFTEGTSTGGRTLYYGVGTSGDNAASVIKIGGTGAFMALEGAQTVGGNKTFSNNVIVGGDLTVNGTTTTVNSTTVTVDDKNLELGSVSTPTDSTADGGGITLKGATDKTFNWVNSTDSWTSSEHIAVASGKSFSGNLTGNVTGSATSLATGRTIGMSGDVSWTSGTFDGTGNVTGTATIAAGAVDMAMINANGTPSSSTYLRGDGSWQTVSVSDTTYSVSCVDGANTDEEIIRLTSSASATDDIILEAGTGLSVARSGDKITFTNTVSDTNTTYSAGTGLGLVGTTFSLGNHSAALLTSGTIPAARVPTLNQDTTGNAATATALASAVNIAGVAFDGSANISLNNNAITNGAGYITSSGDTSGNAGTATALATARNIAGVAFDGTSNIALNNNAITNGAGYITSSGSCASATTAGTATVATNVTASANNSTDETVYLTFLDGATGTQGIETDTGLSYNPSSGLLTVGVIDGGSF